MSGDDAACEEARELLGPRLRVFATAAHGCSWIPGVRSVAQHTTELTAPDAVEAMRILSALLVVAALRPPRP